MNTVIIELTNQKAYKVLKDMEELSLIRILKHPQKNSSERFTVKNRMSEEEIVEQLNVIRKELQNYPD